MKDFSTFLKLTNLNALSFIGMHLTLIMMGGAHNDKSMKLDSLKSDDLFPVHLTANW